MSSSILTMPEPRASKVEVRPDSLIVDLVDGRTIIVPVAWYPRLANGSEAEQRRFQLIGDGTGIHWPDLDEDISIEGLIQGLPSNESRSSLKKWLDARAQAKKPS